MRRDSRTRCCCVLILPLRSSSDLWQHASFCLQPCLRCVFAGNINQLVLRLEPYVQQLRARRGLISEFVNPKYKDDSRTAFKSATRLECMMQVGPLVMCCNVACCLPHGLFRLDIRGGSTSRRPPWNPVRAGQLWHQCSALYIPRSIAAVLWSLYMQSMVLHAAGLCQGPT